MDGNAHQSELDNLAEALSETQDQLLAISTLAQPAEHQFDLEVLLSSIARQAQQILVAQAVFLSIIQESEMPFLVDQPSEYFNPLQIIPQIENNQPQQDTYQVLDLPESTPVYVLMRHIRGKGYLSLGFVVDIPQTELNPTLKLAQIIADQAQIHADNILLHQEILSQAQLQTEMEMARQMQASLLPKKAPDCSGIGLQVGVYFNPASLVGGDFYDLSVKPQGKLNFSVGDLSGKGLPAAIMMSMTLNTIRSKTRFLKNPTPQKILDRVNQDMYDDYTEAGAFATVFIGTYEANSRVLHYGNAGHSPVIFCPAGESAYLLEADGTALGVLPDSMSQSHQLLLKSGDILVVGTDGFSEAENAHGGMFGYEGLLRKVDELGSLAAQEIAEGLVSSIHQFVDGHPQSDDQTLLVLKAI